ncbi:hypothetical protein G1K63_02840 [Tenacibaculum finnmarkense]|uniref:hypothetical protein n=1 Tax=Tenacibaculum finnmarkense TaxID=2781243 RepID=UPI001EFB5755|nr:hypothetical protein [Tenacibaculum finnmarkense]MCG8722462.1 hypothetical protein [Tenacibaculum finnmarkense]
MINYKLLFVFSLFFISLKINAQQFKVVDNKGTINTVFKNTVTTGTPPTTPIEGDVWFDTANSEIKIYDAAVWKKITNTNPLLDNIYTADGTITTDRTITGNTANRFNIGSFKGFFIYNTEYIALQATKGIDFQATNGINLRSTTIAHENFQAIKSFLDKDGDAGTNGQVLSSTGTVTNWVDNTKNKVTSSATNPTLPIENDVWFDTGNNEIKIYDTVDGWKLITSTTAAAGNIYTTDGTLTSSRTLNGASNSLNFTNINTFSVTTLGATTISSGGATVISSGGVTQINATAGVQINGSTTLNGNLELNNALLDINNETGTAGQVLSSTGTGTNWIDSANSTWLAKDDNLTADKNDTEIYKNDNVGIGDFSATTIDAKLHVKSTDVPFKIEPNTTTPTGRSGGQMFVDNTNGILYIYDGTRAKWLSVDRTMVGWGVNNANTGNEYLRQFNGAQSSQNGWRMVRDGTITAISAQTDINQTWALEIRKNDGTIAIASLTITNQQGNHNNTLNIDVNEGDFIQAYCNGTNVSHPETLIEIAWRK